MNNYELITAQFNIGCWYNEEENKFAVGNELNSDKIWIYKNGKDIINMGESVWNQLIQQWIDYSI